MYMYRHAAFFCFQATFDCTETVSWCTAMFHSSSVKNVYFRWITSNFLKCKWHRTANTPFAVHCEKIRNHLRETATSSLARKYEHLRIYMYQIQLRFLHFNQHSIHARNSFPTDWVEPISLYTVCNHGFRVIGDGKNFTVSLLQTVQNVMSDILGSVTFENNCSLYTRD